MPTPDTIIKDPPEPEDKELTRFRRIMALDNKILAVNLQIISKEILEDDGEFELICLFGEIDKVIGGK